MAVVDVFETSSDYLLVLELCREGTLLDFLNREAERARTYQNAEFHLRESQALFVLHQLLDALAYLHAAGTRVAHLNVQPEALMVKTRPNHLQDAAVSQQARNEFASWQYLVQLKLGGFNRACCTLDRVALAAAAVELEQCTSSGAPEELEFLAPELAAAARPLECAAITTRCDLWAAGLIGVLLLTGQSLLYRDGGDAAREALRTLSEEAIGAQLDAGPRVLSSEMRALLVRMLHPQPERRATADELARDPLFANLSTHSDPPNANEPPPNTSSELPHASVTAAAAASATSFAAGWADVTSRRKTFFTLKEVLPKRQGTEKRRRRSTRTAPPLPALELGGTGPSTLPQESSA